MLTGQRMRSSGKYSAREQSCSIVVQRISIAAFLALGRVQQAGVPPACHRAAVSTLGRPVQLSWT